MTPPLQFPCTGKMSTFGGPLDSGVGPEEGLALVELSDLKEEWFARLFILSPSNSRLGLARRLNPDAFYCAMRWNYDQYPRELIRRSIVKLSANSKVIFAQPIDFGPGDGSLVDGQPTPDTGRIIDLSPGAANALHLLTDDLVTVDLILATIEPGAPFP